MHTAQTEVFDQFAVRDLSRDATDLIRRLYDMEHHVRNTCQERLHRDLITFLMQIESGERLRAILNDPA